jgi:hypothetical protein
MINPNLYASRYSCFLNTAIVIGATGDRERDTGSIKMKDLGIYVRKNQPDGAADFVTVQPPDGRGTDEEFRPLSHHKRHKPDRQSLLAELVLLNVLLVRFKIE